MISWLLLVLRTLSGMARSRVSLSAENAILRQQLAELQRGRPRPLLRPADRVLWIWLCRHWNRWRQAWVLIQPATGPEVAPEKGTAVTGDDGPVGSAVDHQSLGATSA